MPLCTIYLLSLSSALPTFLSALQATSPQPLITAKVIRWIITPNKFSVDPLLTQNPFWDILLLYTGDSPLPPSLNPQIRAQWSIKAGVPSRLTTNFTSTNEKLLHPPPSSVPPLTPTPSVPPAANSQNLELSPELSSWITAFQQHPYGNGAVSMLNLLAFKPGMKASYLKYGAAFAESIGSKRGGNAKIVGNVLGCSSTKEGTKEWDEIAIAHYPSIAHFSEMLGSADYQEVNGKHRVPALEDTCILCTSELALPAIERSKL